MNNTILVQIPTEISYWGVGVRQDEIKGLAKALEAMIAREFADAPFELEFEHTNTPRGSGIHGDDKEACDSIKHFIENNWTAVL